VPESLLARRLSRRALIALDALAAAGYALVQTSIVLARAHRAATAATEALPSGASGVSSAAGSLAVGSGAGSAGALPLALAVGLVVAGVLPVAVRRVWPVPVFVVLLVADLVGLLGGVAGASLFPAAFALYLVGAVRSGRRVPTVAIGTVSGIGLLLALVAGTPAPVWDWVGSLVLGLAALGGAWTVGQAVRERRAYAARSAGQFADQAVTEERLRIARELHDVVAHSMGIITVKAAVANHVLRSRPEEATEALRVIETTGRDALTEMRHLLGVLRTTDPPDAAGPASGGGSASGAGSTGGGGPTGAAVSRAGGWGGGGPAAELRPAPGLDGLDELAERAALAGVRVTLEVRAPEPQPQGIQLTAYRIVQEALTNVMRHAAPARCHVAVTAGPAALRVEVTDDGPGRRTVGPAPGAPPGHGLVGMRERVAVYGGTFTAGPRPEGGFGVLATLPYDPPRSVPEGDR
jgi:signal transduction histidine kinase